MDRVKLLRSMKRAHASLLKYREEVKERYYSSNFDTKRQKLVRSLAPLRPIIHSLVGETQLTQRGQVVYPWSEGLSRYRGSGSRSYFFICLDRVIDDVNSAIGALETEFASDVISLRRLARAKPSVLISHGGKTPVRDQLELFLWNRAGVEPVIVEDVPHGEMNPDQKVNDAIEGADFAIVLIEKGRASLQDGKLSPRGNVIDEIERLRLLLRGEFMILLEDGVSLPTNLSSGVTWESFSPDSFDSALLKVVHYLRQHNVM